MMATVADLLVSVDIIVERPSSRPQKSVDAHDNVRVIGVEDANKDEDCKEFCGLSCNEKNIMFSSLYDDDDGGEGVGARRMCLPYQRDRGEGNDGRRTRGRAERRVKDANDDHDVFCFLSRKNNLMPSSSYDGDDGGKGVRARRMRLPSQRDKGEDDDGRRT